MFKNRDFRDGLDLRMKRIDKICQELERLTSSLSKSDLQKEVAFTAESIGINLGLARNSVSKDLNQLWNEQRVIKVKTRPVYFLHRQTIETLLGSPLPDHLAECCQWSIHPHLTILLPRLSVSTVVLSYRWRKEKRRCCTQAVYMCC